MSVCKKCKKEIVSGNLCEYCQAKRNDKIKKIGLWGASITTFALSIVFRKGRK